MRGQETGSGQAQERGSNEASKKIGSMLSALGVSKRLLLTLSTV